MTEDKRRIVTFLLLIVFIWGIYLPTGSCVSAAKLKTYVIYDSPTRYGSTYPLVNALIEHLGHFELECRPLELKDWQPGLLNDAELVVYVGLKDDATLPAGLLQEMGRAPRVIWFERNIEQLAASLYWQDFHLEGIYSGWSLLHFKRDMFLNEWINVGIAQPGQNAQIFATVKNVGAVRPLAWQRDQVYYCGLLEVDQSYMIFLSQLLHQFVPNNHEHAASRRVLNCKNSL
jgi:hypothetical protein